MSTRRVMRSREPVSTILARLTEGNARFVAGEPRLATVDPETRAALARGQHPSVAALTCSDSRVSPELIFDQGLGDLFVVRVAGNVVDETVLSSLEYAVEHLAVALILVLGHSGCGAVTSACSYNPDELQGASDSVLKAIRPAVEAARAECQAPDELIDTSARLNVAGQIEAVLASPVVRHSIADRRLTVMGAWYDLETGLISWL